MSIPVPALFLPEDADLFKALNMFGSWCDPATLSQKPFRVANPDLRCQVDGYPCHFKSFVAAEPLFRTERRTIPMAVFTMKRSLHRIGMRSFSQNPTERILPKKKRFTSKTMGPIGDRQLKNVNSPIGPWMSIATPELQIFRRSEPTRTFPKFEPSTLLKTQAETRIIDDD